MATSSIERTINDVVQKIAEALKDTTEITVKTSYVEVDANPVTPQDAKLVAQTTISLDGDYDAIVPMRKNAAGVLEIDQALFDLHLENVRSAREYRDGLIQALLSVVRPTNTQQ
jgi:hypothetical protein